jgi:hypothetical protein
MKKQNNELKVSNGWRGNVYYPDGPDGNGFGIEILPDGRVWFPMLKADNDKVQKASLETCQPLQETVSTANGIYLSTLMQNVTDNSCLICGSPVPGKRLDRRYCSAKCRKRASRGKQLSLAGVGL